jgi:hypothetical protein
MLTAIVFSQYRSCCDPGICWYAHLIAAEGALFTVGVEDGLFWFF